MAENAVQTPAEVQLPQANIEHLRTVHFTLVAVSLALIILATSSRRGLISNARSELASIIQLNRNWKEDWIKTEVERAPSHPTLPTPSAFAAPSGKSAIQFHAKGNEYFVALNFKGPNWLLNSKDDALEVQFSEQVPGELTKRPDTLASFHKLWDDLNKDLVFKVPTEIDSSPLILFQEANTQRTPLPAKFIEKSDNYSPLELDLAASMSQLGLPKEKGVFYGGVEKIEGFGVVTIAVPITDNQSFPFDGQGALISQFPQWRHGTFAHTFSALYEITKDYEALDLETIDRILAAEEDRTAESFEAVGMKFPAELIIRWGMFLVIAIQGYLCLHLYELPAGLVKQNQSHVGSWIGVYRSRYARFAYFASTVLLPIACIVILFVRPLYLYGLKGYLHLSLGMICVIFSVILAWLSWKLTLSRMESL